ncbi:MAG: RnfABCDGE type electron transport complex subunit G [Bacteroidaceae bacterium]|nr:RnfABCDGE type electron transport complex subunit G [Bacteroidaceae bacterium]
MKKLKSTLPNMAIVLTSIAVVAGLALGYVNSITAEPIKQIKAQQLSDGIKAVLATDEVQVETPDTLESGAVLYRTDKGVAVQATDPNGFGGKLTVLVGFNDEGLIQGYQVLETSETPGLGAKAGEWFQKGAKGDIIGKNPGEKELTVSKDGGEVDAITASTITSRAFLRCVNAAYEALDSQKEDAQTGASVQYHNEEKEENYE